jgi:hypothetical protein
MDLLTGYESSASDNDEENESNLRTRVSESAVTAAQHATANNNTATLKKGKKMIRLAAVLPQHVLDRLTKSSSTYAEDDSDDDDVSRPNKNTAATRVQTNTINSGMSDFLMDLKAAPTKGIVGNNNNTTSGTLPITTTTGREQEPLGHAFLQTTTTTTKSKDKQLVVRNVHAESEPARVGPTSNVQQTTYSTVPQRFPGMARVNAAPKQRVVAETSTQQQHEAFVEQPQYPRSTFTQEPTTTTSTALTNNTKKRSRKELERALRHGDLDAVQGSETSILQQEDSNYVPVPSPETSTLPSHKIRVAATAMYDPSAGAAVVGLSKGKGKNQIHHVMAAAAQLELQRARNTSNTSNTHRANAKQKYGW